MYCFVVQTLLNMINCLLGIYPASETQTQTSGKYPEDNLSLLQHGESLTLRSLTLYIYGAPILDVSRSHTTTQHSR